MGKPGKRGIERIHSLFIDDLKVYKQDHHKLQVATEIIVKASIGAGACSGLKSVQKLCTMLER